MDASDKDFNEQAIVAYTITQFKSLWLICRASWKKVYNLHSLENFKLGMLRSRRSSLQNSSTK
jgi:hypothetical protein